MPEPALPPRSRWVSVLAWLTIGLSVACIPFLLLGLAALPMMADAVMFSGISVALGALAAFVVVQLVMGIGLVQRKNWARMLLLISAIALAVWQAIDLAAPSDLGQLLPEALQSDPAMVAALSTATMMARVLGVLIIVACGWVLYRFTRPDMRAEFGAA